MAERLRIAVVGAGAVGGYFGGRLAASGEDVVFIARGKTLEALRQEGLNCKSILGDFRVRPVKVTDEPESVGAVDVVILGVKAWQVKEAMLEARPLIGSSTCVLPLQNGVEAIDQICQIIGSERTLGGTCKLVCLTDRPGVVHHRGATPEITLGELNNQPSHRLERLAGALKKAGINTIIARNIQAAIWEKFLFVAAVGGLSAVARCNVGELREDPQLRDMLGQCLGEIYALAHACQVELDPTAIRKNMEFIDSLPPQSTASMQRDINQGRPSELEAQTGTVVRLAAGKEVAVPVNHFIYHCLLPQERRSRRAG